MGYWKSGVYYLSGDGQIPRLTQEQVDGLDLSEELDSIWFNTTKSKTEVLENGVITIFNVKSGKVISSNYTLTEKSEDISIENLTSDIVIAIPDISSNSKLIFTNWRIIRNDNSSYKVYVSLDNPSDGVFGTQFHTLELVELGSGIEVYCNSSSKYTYARYDGLLLTVAMPIVVTSSANLNGTTLNMSGNIDSLGFNTSVNVYFRYREEGTTTWFFTTPQTIGVIGGFTDTATVTAGAIYEVQAVLEDSKSILYYGEVILSVIWIDLRSGGDVLTHGNGAGNDVRYRSGMSLTRDANGMYFTGSNPWSSWVKFESLVWTRGENKTIQMIFTRPEGAMMLGIGSDATNETNTSQYSQAEVEAYFNSSTNLYGLYGNNGILGNGVSQSTNTNVSGGSGVFKIKFTNDGTINQSVFTLYELPSANESDWDDESNTLVSITNTAIGADEFNLMPFIIPRNGGTQRFVAIKVS